MFLIGLDRLRVLDAGTGRPLWDVEPAGEFDMALAAAGDAVYAIEKSVGRSRRAIEVRSYGLAAGELRWTVPLAGAGGWLGLRNFTAADGVICLGLDMQAPHPAVYGFEP